MTSRARSGRPRARRAARARRPAVRASPRRLIPAVAGSGWRYRRSSFAARRVEHVALRRLVAGPGDELAHVARRHAERVGHDRRQVGGRLAVEDPGQRAGEEPVRPVVEAEVGAHEQQLGERPRVERDARPRPGRPPSARRVRRRCRRPARTPTGGRRAPGRDRRGRASAPASPAHTSRSAASRVRASAGVAGSSLAEVSTWASGLRSLPTPMRPSAAAWTGAVPRPENGSRTTSPGRL